MRMRSNGSLILLGTLALGCGPSPESDGGETSTTGDDLAGDSDGDGDSTSSSEGGEECLEPVIIDGSVVIADASEIADYDCVVEITGNLEFEGVEMPTLDGFPRLERVGGVLFIGWTASLESIPGFPVLREVGSLWIDGHDSLARIDGFGELEHVGEDLVLAHLPVLSNIDGLGAVTSVGEELSLRVLGTLESLAALRIASVGEYVQVRDCDALVDLSGLDELAVLPRVLIQDNDALLSLAGLDAATEAESLLLENNAALANIDALVELELITDDLRIRANPELASLAGFVALGSIGGDLELVDNDALLELDGPAFPMTVTGQIQICENGSLVALPMMLGPTAAEVSVIRNRSLPNDVALEFVAALGHPDAKVAGNEDLADYPIDPCPFVGDGVCDEPEKIEGDVVMACDSQTGHGCCDFGGPTGLCLYESEGEPDCPVAGSRW